MSPAVQNIPEDVRKGMCRPIGTFMFSYVSQDLFDMKKQGGIVLEIAAKGQVFRIERDHNLLLLFYHFSPGTGSRVATIDLKTIQPSSNLTISFTWTPSAIALYCWSNEHGKEMQSGSGQPSLRQFRAGKDGNIYQIGDDGLQSMEISVYNGERPVLLPTALESWRAALMAAEILARGKSEDGFIFEVAISNLTISLLITGFETYMSTRFLELEEEGIDSDVLALVDAFFSKPDRESGVMARLEKEAIENNSSILRRILENKKINFQSYDNCKKAYNKAYKIKFGELELGNETLNNIQEYFWYRHRIVHVSPLIAMLNQPRVPSHDPVFSTQNLAVKVKNEFDTFIQKFHQATLKLSPDN